MTCSSSLLDPDGSCFLWTLYNNEGKKIMCEDIKDTCEAYVPSFLKISEEQRAENYRKLLIETRKFNIAYMSNNGR